MSFIDEYQDEVERRARMVREANFAAAIDRDEAEQVENTRDYLKGYNKGYACALEHMRNQMKRLEEFHGG